MWPRVINWSDPVTFEMHKCTDLVQWLLVEFALATNGFQIQTKSIEVTKVGSPGWIRTTDQAVNSRLLYH